MRPHSSAVRVVRQYGRRCAAIGGIRRPLSLVYNPNWCMEFTAEDGTKSLQYDPDTRFMMVQTIPMVEEVEGIRGLGYSRRVEFPVLFVPHAHYPDNRWIPALEEGRNVNFLQRWLAKKRKEEERLKRKYMNYAEDFAKDQYTNFMRWTDQWRFANISARHRSLERRREFEQRMGRRRGRVKPSR